MLHFAFMPNNDRTRTLGVRSEPLSPRSIVLSVLLGSHPPQMSVGRLLEFTSLFDLADGTVRTALSRMVAAGDLVNNEGMYRLAGRLIERQAQQDAGRHHPPTNWDGTWWTVSVLANRRTMAERRNFRVRAAGSRLGELRPDLWLRPANIDVPGDLPDALVTRGSIITGNERRLVRQLWDLTALQTQSATHQRALDDAAFRLRASDDRSLADAFAALAGAQRFLRVEPQLPTEIDPHATGAVIRTRYAEVLTEFQAQLAEFFDDRKISPASSDPISTAGR
jgi:phenylacetic acid degradation operon negative regulatory protein